MNKSDFVIMVRSSDTTGIMTSIEKTDLVVNVDTDTLPDIRLKCPDLASIIPGRRFLYRAKVGGERQTVTVTASTAPYPRDFGKGRKAMYVTVYGYEGKWTVPASKLRIAEKV